MCIRRITRDSSLSFALSLYISPSYLTAPPSNFFSPPFLIGPMCSISSAWGGISMMCMRLIIIFIWNSYTAQVIGLPDEKIDDFLTACLERLTAVIQVYAFWKLVKARPELPIWQIITKRSRMMSQSERWTLKEIFDDNSFMIQRSVRCVTEWTCSSQMSVTFLPTAWG